MSLTSYRAAPPRVPRDGHHAPHFAGRKSFYALNLARLVFAPAGRSGETGSRRTITGIFRLPPRLLGTVVPACGRGCLFQDSSHGCRLNQGILQGLRKRQFFQIRSSSNDQSGGKSPQNSQWKTRQPEHEYSAVRGRFQARFHGRGGIWGFSIKRILIKIIGKSGLIFRPDFRIGLLPDQHRPGGHKTREQRADREHLCFYATHVKRLAARIPRFGGAAVPPIGEIRLQPKTLT